MGREARAAWSWFRLKPDKPMWKANKLKFCPHLVDSAKYFGFKSVQWSVRLHEEPDQLLPLRHAPIKQSASILTSCAPQADRRTHENRRMSCPTSTTRIPVATHSVRQQLHFNIPMMNYYHCVCRNREHRQSLLKFTMTLVEQSSPRRSSGGGGGCAEDIVPQVAQRWVCARGPALLTICPW